MVPAGVVGLVGMGLGLLAGLCAGRALPRALLLTVALILIQSLGWAVFAASHEAGQGWGSAAAGGFRWALTVATPYTVVGACLSGFVAVISQRSEIVRGGRLRLR